MRTAMSQEPVVLLMSPRLSLVLMAIIARKNTKGCHYASVLAVYKVEWSRRWQLRLNGCVLEKVRTLLL